MIRPKRFCVLLIRCRVSRPDANIRRCLDIFYKAYDTLEMASYKNVVAWRARMEARPATAKGLLINSNAEGGAFQEYHS